MLFYCIQFTIYHITVMLFCFGIFYLILVFRFDGPYKYCLWFLSKAFRFFFHFYSFQMDEIEQYNLFFLPWCFIRYMLFTACNFQFFRFTQCYSFYILSFRLLVVAALKGRLIFYAHNVETQSNKLFGNINI